MIVTAVPLKFTGNRYTVVDTGNFTLLADGDDEGNITINVTSNKLALNGNFKLGIIFSAAEIQQLVRASHIGRLEERMEALEERLREFEDG